MKRKKTPAAPGGAASDDRKSGKPSQAGRVVLRMAVCLVTVLGILAGTVYLGGRMVAGDTSPAASELFLTTLLETGQLKFLARWFASPERIEAVVAANSMGSFEGEIDPSLITLVKDHDSGQGNTSGEGSEGSSAGKPETEEQDVTVIPVSGATFAGTLLIVRDPSRVSLATIYPWREKGVTLDELVKSAGAVGGINAGLYHSSGNSGGWPTGVVVSEGQILRNRPSEAQGMVLIGLTEEGLLQIVDLNGMTPTAVEAMIREKRIRDAVCFQEEASDRNNHFVTLVRNGEARSLTGTGSGLNPRTAIGQRKDGALLLLVTDGRGASGHLGASAADLIDLMLSYGAVNAANLDGGSSSCMYWEGAYLQTSVTFYYANSSWRLPFAFVIR